MNPWQTYKWVPRDNIRWRGKKYKYKINGVQRRGNLTVWLHTAITMYKYTHLQTTHTNTHTRLCSENWIEHSCIDFSNFFVLGPIYKCLLEGRGRTAPQHKQFRHTCMLSEGSSVRAVCKTTSGSLGMAGWMKTKHRRFGPMRCFRSFQLRTGWTASYWLTFECQNNKNDLSKGRERVGVSCQVGPTLRHNAQIPKYINVFYPFQDQCL